MALDPITRRGPSIADLAANTMGLTFAAFGPITSIARLLGCDESEARAFQEDAASDFVRLRVAIAQARSARPS